MEGLPPLFLFLPTRFRCRKLLLNDIELLSNISKRCCSQHTHCAAWIGRIRNALCVIRLSYASQVTSVIEQTDLPSNPLDMLIDMLGGPEKVAEMTGRKGRMVRSDNRIRWEPRNASGADGTSLEAINVAEAGFFMSGRKLVAIISDAASAGISLHADR